MIKFALLSVTVALLVSQCKAHPVSSPLSSELATIQNDSKAIDTLNNRVKRQGGGGCGCCCGGGGGGCCGCCGGGGGGGCGCCCCRPKCCCCCRKCCTCCRTCCCTRCCTCCRPCCCGGGCGCCGCGGGGRKRRSLQNMRIKLADKLEALAKVARPENETVVEEKPLVSEAVTKPAVDVETDAVTADV